MPDYRRSRLRGGTYFFTVVTYRRYPIFEYEAAIYLLNQCFKATIVRHSFKMDAFVILPDHLHCIWTLPENDLDFSTRWKRIKTSFTRNYCGGKANEISESMRKKRETGVWQRRFWEHRIRDQEDFNRHCDYIHYNPVKHGFVRLPVEWAYSSFKEFVENGYYERTWGNPVQAEIMSLDWE